MNFNAGYGPADSSAFNRILKALFVVAVFLLALNKVSDIDAWIHLSMGRLIWDLKGLPDHELFTYPVSELIYPYTSWVFGLLCYIIYTSFGASGLVLLKTIVITAVFIILLKDSLRPYNNYVVSVVVMTAALILSRYRFVLRPDIFFMLFLSFSIFSMNAYLYDKKKYIYALPLVHLLWVNTHTSIAVMAVPFIAFIAGGLLQQHLGKRGTRFENTPSSAQVKTMGIVFVASIAATFLSPYFMDQLVYGFKVLDTEWYRQHVMEMRPPGDSWVLMWGIAAIVLASFVLNRQKYSIIHFLLVAPFIFLPFSAIRFTFVIAIATFPVLARNISASIESKGLAPSKMVQLIAVILVVLLGAVMVYKNVDEEKFGFGMDESSMPRGAIEYMDRNDIYGRVLNPYAFGQYIIWKSYPKRTVFVDGRGHMPEELLDKMLRFNTSPAILDELYRKYGFESVLTNYSFAYGQENTPNALSTQHQWALVYWDDVSLLYLRRGGPYDAIIAKDEYRTVIPEVPPNYILDSLEYAEYRDKLIPELERNVAVDASAWNIRANTFLGYAYLSDGQTDIAQSRLVKAIQNAPNNASAYYGLGLLYSERGTRDKAERSFRKCVSIMKTGRLADDARRKLLELSE